MFGDGWGARGDNVLIIFIMKNYLKIIDHKMYKKFACKSLAISKKKIKGY